MFDKNKYWYKDDFIQINDNEEHGSFVSKINSNYQFNKNIGNAEACMLIKNAGYARITIHQKNNFAEYTLYCSYNKNFNNCKKLFEDIVSNLTPRITQIVIDDSEKNLTLSVEQFLSKSSMPKPKINEDRALFSYGDLVRLTKDIPNDWISLEKDDIGVILEMQNDIVYAIYFKSKGRYEWISADCLELVKKFEWPEQ